MSSKYAQGTTVLVEKSRQEIENTLRRFGAEGFMYAYEGNSRLISFKHQGRLIRFTLSIPDVAEFKSHELRQGANAHFKGYVRTVHRTDAQARTALEAEERRLWRSLANAVKAKLETVQSGILTFEEEFLAYTVTPSGQTIAELMLPQIDHILASGQMPALMPGVRNAH